MGNNSGVSEFPFFFFDMSTQGKGYKEFEIVTSVLWGFIADWAILGTFPKLIEPCHIYSPTIICVLFENGVDVL